MSRENLTTRRQRVLRYVTDPSRIDSLKFTNAGLEGGTIVLKRPVPNEKEAVVSALEGAEYDVEEPEPADPQNHKITYTEDE